MQVGGASITDRDRYRPWTKLMAWQVRQIVEGRVPEPALRVYLVLAQYEFRQTGLAWPSNEIIDERTGLHPRNRRRALAELRRLGWVSLEYKDPNNSKTRRFRLATGGSIHPGSIEPARGG